MAYEIALPLQLTNLHPVFHVSQLRKYVFDPAHVLEAEDIQIREDLTVEVPPIALEDSKVEERRGKTVSLVKVIWDRRTGLDVGVRGGHEKITSTSVCLVSLYFRGRKFSCWGECKAPFLFCPLLSSHSQ